MIDEPPKMMKTTKFNDIHNNDVYDNDDAIKGDDDESKEEVDDDANHDGDDDHCHQAHC